MRKRCVYVLLICVCFCASLPVCFAAQDEYINQLPIENGAVTAPDIQSVIDIYFSNREYDAFYKNTTVTMSEANVSPNVLQNETLRISALESLQDDRSLSFVSMKNTPIIRNAFIHDGKLAYADIYEWTTVRYMSGNSTIVDVMGYATEHDVLLECKDGKWIVTYDNYAEFGNTDSVYDLNLSIAESFSLDDSVETFFQSAKRSGQVHSIDAATLIKASNESLVSTTSYTYNYDVSLAIEYADEWVPHIYSSESMMNPSYYNPDFSIGGASDCQNYVSQCLYAGGIEMDNNWYYNIDSHTWSSNWTRVRDFHNYWSSILGNGTVYSDGSNVYPGNPVYYVNDPGAPSSGHATICVGYNSAGVPIINGHNRDVFHVPYNMAGSNLRTIYFTSDDEYGYNPYPVDNLGVITSAITVNADIDPDYCQWFKFTITTEDSYAIYSSTYGSNGDIDLLGTLYLECYESNDHNLFMYTIGSNDNSGAGDHFRISKVLEPGVYFLRVESASNSDYGLYKLNIYPQ